MTASPPRSLSRPPRDLRVDIARGYMQLQIFASHAFGSFIGGWMIHASWGLSDGSEQFVFLSGLGLGSVFTLKSNRDGARAALLDLFARIRRLYRNYLIVFFLFAAMAILAARTLPLGDELGRLGFTWLVERPILAVPAAFTTLYQPMFMGILPNFLWCMLLLPIFFKLLDRFGDWVLALPIASYLFVQFTGWTPRALGDTGVAFDPLAWQLPYLIGAWVGRRRLVEGRSVPPHPLLIAGAVAVVIFGFGFRLIEYGWAPGPQLDSTLVAAKETLAVPRLLHALSLAYLVGCFVPREADWMRGRAGVALAAVGRNSLNVFCLGLFLSYIASLFYRLLPGHWWLDPLLIGAGCAVLLAWARWLEGQRKPVQPAVARPIAR